MVPKIGTALNKSMNNLRSQKHFDGVGSHWEWGKKSERWRMRSQPKPANGGTYTKLRDSALRLAMGGRLTQNSQRCVKCSAWHHGPVSLGATHEE